MRCKNIQTNWLLRDFVNGIVVALLGKVAEWFKAAVLKTVVAPCVTVSSNLTLSARIARSLSGEVPEWTNGAAC